MEKLGLQKAWGMQTDRVRDREVAAVKESTDIFFLFHDAPITTSFRLDGGSTLNRTSFPSSTRPSTVVSKGARSLKSAVQLPGQAGSILMVLLAFPYVCISMSCSAIIPVPP